MKKLFKTYFLLLVILTVSITFTGCGSESTQTATVKKNETPAPAAEVMPTVTPVQTEAPAQVAVKEAAKRWTKPEPEPEPPTTDTPYTTKRTRLVTEHGLPDAYKDLKNPLAPTTDNLTAGGILFSTRCALCHGNKGKGDGVAGAALNPPASDLSKIAAMKISSSGYLLWAVSDGGGRLGSAMPTFNIMPEEERWQVILFLQHEIAGN